MIRCARCNRQLRNPVHIAGMSLGPKCAAAVAGHKPRRGRIFTIAAQVVDTRQADLFDGACS